MAIRFSGCIDRHDDGVAIFGKRPASLDGKTLLPDWSGSDQKYCSFIEVTKCGEGIQILMQLYLNNCSYKGIIALTHTDGLVGFC